MNHYYHTISTITDLYCDITRYVMFLELSRTMKGEIYEKWQERHPEQDYIPSDWMRIQEQLGKVMWTPNFIDLIRFRSIDYSAIRKRVDEEYAVRFDLIGELGLKDDSLHRYIYEYKP